MFQVGSIVGGRLRIDQILGAGGMGVVAAATHLELGHRVAVKVLREELAENPTIVERFIREARAVVNLKTEHVCRVFDVGRLDNGAPYIVMELLAGSDLARTIANRPLPVSTAVDYVLQACAALAEAHAAGIIHRDLKPANLFVTRRFDGGPLVKVLDFGIAKAMDATGPQLTQATSLIGSPGYMSPEQLQSARDVDVRTDIWALGVTLYQLLSGRMPFASANLTEIAVKVASDPPAPIDLDPALQAVILRCLEKLPARRYPSVAELSMDLVRFASSDGRKTATIVAQLTHVQSASATVPVPSPVSMDAATAASVASRAQAPSAPPAAPAVTAPRRRWPLLVGGGVALVGASVAVTLAVNRDRAPAPAPTPAPETPVVTAGPARDATIVSGDPWQARDAGPEPDAAPVDAASGEVEVTSAGSATGFERQMAAMAKQVTDSCRQVVSNEQLAKMPAMQINLGICWCILGDPVKAQAAYAKVLQQDYRQSVKTTCAQYGVKLRD